MPPTTIFMKENKIMNMNNFSIVRGRLVADPAVFGNKDGSSKVKFSVAAENNFKSKDGKRDSQIIPVEAYVKDYASSPFSKIHKGDKVSCECSLRNNNYKDANGNMVYSLIVFVEGIQFEESKSVTEARAAARAAEAATAAPVAAAAPATVPVQA